MPTHYRPIESFNIRADNRTLDGQEICSPLREENWSSLFERRRTAMPAVSGPITRSFAASQRFQLPRTAFPATLINLPFITSRSWSRVLHQREDRRATSFARECLEIRLQSITSTSGAVIALFIVGRSPRRFSWRTHCTNSNLAFRGKR